MKYVVGLLFCMFSFAGEEITARAAPSGSFQVIQMPGEAYLNEPVTFVLQGRVGTTVTVALDQEQLLKRDFQLPRMELNLSFSRGGMLSFSCGDMTRTCRLLMPTDKASLTMREGFLYEEDTPVVLVLPHRHPPKHNRKWEVLDVIQSLLNDTRPQVSRVTLVSGLSPANVDLAELSYLTETSQTLWHIPKVEDTVFEVDQLVLARVTATAQQAVVVMFSGRDFRRGIHPTHFRMRLEWALMKHNNCQHIFVVSMPLSRGEREQFPEAEHFLRLAAEANGAEYLSVNTRGMVIDRISDVVERMLAKVRF